MKSIATLIALALLTTAGPLAAVDHDHAAGGHGHQAPHGGTVVTVGAAHAELVLDPEGGIHLYVLGDDEAKAKPIAAKTLTAQVKAAGSEAFVAVNLEPKPLDGEAKDTASHFMGTNASLKGVASAEVVVRLDLDGKTQRAAFTVKPTAAKAKDTHGHGQEADHKH